VAKWNNTVCVVTHTQQQQQQQQHKQIDSHSKQIKHHTVLIKGPVKFYRVTAKFGSGLLLYSLALCPNIEIIMRSLKPLFIFLLSMQLMLTQKYIVIAVSPLSTNSTNGTNLSIGRTLVHCIHLGLASEIHSQLILGDTVLVSDNLHQFNTVLPVVRGDHDTTALKLCVHIKSTEITHNDVTKDALVVEKVKWTSEKSNESNKFARNHELKAPIQVAVDGGASTHHNSSSKNIGIKGSMLQFAGYDAPSVSSITTVNVNSLVDSVVNVSACVAATSPPSSLSGACNVRSALAYCTSTWNTTTSDTCIVNLPSGETMYFDPSLGEIRVDNVGGSLMIEGNNCTVTTASGVPPSSRFLSAQVSDKDTTVLKVLLRNIKFVSFHDMGSTGGGVLFLSGLSSITITNITVKSTQARSGGCMYISKSDNIDISFSFFSNTSATSKGGAIYVHDSNTAVQIVGCTFTNTSATMYGGAIYVFDTNYDLAIVECRFVGTSVAYDGGAIYLHQNNNRAAIRGCKFHDTTAGNTGGAIHIYNYNNDITVFNCSFVNTIATVAGGAIDVNQENKDMEIADRTFVVHGQALMEDLLRVI
jgi:predicted outer membrane repeat protein